MFPSNKTGDGTTKVFPLTFADGSPIPFLAEADIKIKVDGAAKTLGTDYALQVPDRDSGPYTIRFFTAPAASADNISITRETPLTASPDNPEMDGVTAKRALYIVQEWHDTPPWTPAE